MDKLLRIYRCQAKVYYNSIRSVRQKGSRYPMPIWERLARESYEICEQDRWDAVCDSSTELARNCLVHGRNSGRENGLESRLDRLFSRSFQLSRAKMLQKSQKRLTSRFFLLYSNVSINLDRARYCRAIVFRARPN